MNLREEISKLQNTKMMKKENKLEEYVRVIKKWALEMVNQPTDKLTAEGVQLEISQRIEKSTKKYSLAHIFGESMELLEDMKI